MRQQVQQRTRSDMVRQRLRADLIRALPDAAVALVVAALVFALLYQRVANGISDTVAVMGHMNDPNRYAAYWLSQAFGWAALLWSWLTVMLGLLLGGRTPAWLSARRAGMERLHRSTSITVIALMFLHALVLIWDNAGDTLAASFVPWAQYEGGKYPITVGIVAFYLTAVLGVSYYLRDRIGARAWRAAHRLVVVAYALSVYHTLIYGTNVWFQGWPRTLLWALQLPVAVLLVARLVKPARSRERLVSVHVSGVGVRLALRWAAAALAVVAALALTVALLTGHLGGHVR